MAQGAATLQNGAALSASELREILEYERIVQFRDNVLAGNHPRIKIPPHLVSKQSNTARLPSSSALSSAQPNSSTFGARNETPSSIYNVSRDGQRQTAATSIPLPAKPSRSEINPILLEKSEDLIKAEMLLQRQRLERALREQIDQQRVVQKALLQTSESLPNFDISEVLKEALALVQPSATAEVEPTVAAQSPASDSFDENTFYSSQHDTPDPTVSSQGSREQGELLPRDLAVVHNRLSENLTRQPQAEDQKLVMADPSRSKDNHLGVHVHLQSQESQSASRAYSGLSQISADMVKSVTGNVPPEGNSDFPVNLSTNGSGNGSTQQNSSTDSRSTSQRDLDRAAARKATEDLLKQAFEDDVAPPLIRAHDLSPVAPQPARVSPLVTAREPPILREATIPEPITQLRAPRNKHSGVSSTDSSPSKVQKGSGKKERRKKPRKRKAKEIADSPDSPYIKPEPRSPSPFVGAPLPRPQKRQRQVGQYAAELNYDEPRYDSQPDPQERAPQYREPRVRRTDGRLDEHYEPEYRRPEPVYQRLGDDQGEYRRVSGIQYAQRPESPAVLGAPYGNNEFRPLRTVSHSVIDRRIPEEPRYYREPVPRITVRPDADRERSRSPLMRYRESPSMMAPPRQPVRIVVDAYGREYIDPTPAPSMRVSMAPPSRYIDADVMYERALIRGASIRPPATANEEGSVVYRRSPQPVAAPRRVVTQPEYAPPDYRSYRQREYSVRPVEQPSEEYIPIRGAPEHRQPTHSEEFPREHVARASSIRPGDIRYEVPQDYAGRVQSVRPDLPVREYSVRPEIRREMPSQAQREYNVRPVDSISRREPLPITDKERRYEEVSSRRLLVPERRYEEASSGQLAPAERRGYEEVPRRRLVDAAFIERPRAREHSILMYGDDVRREVYR